MKNIFTILFFLFIIFSCKDDFVKLENLHNEVVIDLFYDSMPYLRLEITQGFDPVIGNESLRDSTFIKVKNISNLSLDSIQFLLHVMREENGAEVLAYPYSMKLKGLKAGGEYGPVSIANATDHLIERDKVKGWLTLVPGGNPYGGVYQGTLDGFTKDSVRVFPSWGLARITAKGEVRLSPVSGDIKELNGYLSNDGRIMGSLVGENGVVLSTYRNSDSTLAVTVGQGLLVTFVPDNMVVLNDTIHYFEMRLHPQ